MNFWRANLFVAASFGLVGACRTDDAPRPPASASAVVPAPAPPVQRSIDALLAAEQARNSAAINESDLIDRDVVRRRVAVRALARIADGRAGELLRRSLADEDLEIVAWSAHGLGYTCKGHEREHVRRLIARAASLLADSASVAELAATKPLSPVYAIADALARCGSEEAERSLTAWLEQEPAIAELSARALGNLASRAGKLDDSTQVALLDAAGAAQHPNQHALFAFTRLTALAPTVQRRLEQVAQTTLDRPGPARAFTIRALGAATPEAAPLLARVLTSGTATERADAARQLGRLGAPGQAALARALLDVTVTPELLAGDGSAALDAVLRALLPSTREARPALDKLAELPISGDMPATIRRRAIAVRCRAASLVAGTASLAKRLVACDPDPGGRRGALAVLEVLDRGPLQGDRFQRYAKLLEASDPLVQQAALQLLTTHPELPRVTAQLVSVLQSDNPGTVTVAAQVLAAAPARAGDASSGNASIRPDPEIVKALSAAFERTYPEDALELRAALIDAAAALELLSLKPRIEAYCTSAHPTLRERAAKALAQFGERGRQCREFEPHPQPAIDSAVRSPVRLTFVTDAGERWLELDAAYAPAAVRRIVGLARSGFYDGMTVHRVVPGFVAQFGDPDADGYGGAGRPPLACETTPLPFDAGSVGLALSGRDTGSSQLFVTLGSYPHLDGSYPWLGRAGPGWETLAPGDVIQKVKID